MRIPSARTNGETDVIAMRSDVLIFTTAVILLIINAPARGSEGVSFDVSASCTVMHPEDTLKIAVTVKITGDERNFSISEVPSPEIENFTLISTGSAVMRSIIDSLPVFTRSTNYYFMPQQPGYREISAMTLEYTDRTTGAVHSLSSAPFRIEVYPAGTRSGRATGAVVLGTLVVAVISISIIVYFRVQRNRRSGGNELESSSFKLQVLESLRKAEIALAHGRLKEGQQMTFDSLTEYIGNRYGPAESTISKKDIYQALVDHNAPSALRDIYLELREWDGELKYGGIPRSRQEIGAVIDELRHFLEQSS